MTRNQAVHVENGPHQIGLVKIIGLFLIVIWAGQGACNSKIIKIN